MKFKNIMRYVSSCKVFCKLNTYVHRLRILFDCRIVLLCKLFLFFSRYDNSGENEWDFYRKPKNVDFEYFLLRSLFHIFSKLFGCDERRFRLRVDENCSGVGKFTNHCLTSKIKYYM